MIERLIELNSGFGKMSNGKTMAEGETKELVRKAHAIDSVLPNDWVYSKMSELISAVLDYANHGENIMEDVQFEIIDGCVDIYNADLLEWAKMFSHYVDEARDEGLIADDTDMMRQLMCGQHQQLTGYYNLILEDIGCYE